MAVDVGDHSFSLLAWLDVDKMWGLVQLLVDYLAPIFLVLSPITSYADQIASIHRKKSCDGFSLDIPLIMLLASILKVFYWFGAYYDQSLLAQASLMIVVQLILLKVALDNRAPSGGSEKGGVQHTPFHGYTHNSPGNKGMLWDFLMEGKRPFGFWQWNGTKPYFVFLAYFTTTLLFIHVFLPILSRTPFYITFLGYVGLAVEAILPIPQMLKNHRARSCKGFRLSVIVNWLAGDAMKMSYFFLSKEYVPWPFRLCGIFQACCDVYLGLQFLMYGQGPAGMREEVPMANVGAGSMAKAGFPG
ncbi:alpha 1,3-glucosidase [Cladophialophora psammophila CBS 110553]|uniref:Alpha 1,3-glucosidase n=1 Tax=Cladophialophora psammophila CBS 110553 TaxID=1182543 RepID=W9XHE8_9EURO|nr:alpha 1,3-glucosidase [Cladophialophora psammophila CBS 110553]EXJ69789.1 alpha 1,3-glucosidase [Cladophialophora psammophila CBS 110553]